MVPYQEASIAELYSHLRSFIHGFRLTGTVESLKCFMTTEIRGTTGMIIRITAVTMKTTEIIMMTGIKRSDK